jgi:hypothetical protein
MELFHSPQQYLYNLQTTSSSKAKKIWKETIKENWNNECAYCGSRENLTLDHIVPLSNGGLDITPNIVCCCRDCNHNKSHNKWEDWYKQKEFFSSDRYEKILKWMTPSIVKNLYAYRPRRNNCT